MIFLHKRRHKAINENLVIVVVIFLLFVSFRNDYKTTKNEAVYITLRSNQTLFYISGQKLISLSSQCYFEI